MHTSDLFLEKVLKAMKVSAFPTNSPTVDLDAWLDKLSTPENLGCGHLRLMLQLPEKYKVDIEVSKALLCAFHTLLWDPH